MPKVSIIIPVYNGAAFIEEAIQSALDQTFSDFDLIVIDDGSTDETPRAVTQFGKRVRYFRQTNQGRSRARNKGLELADGEYVAFLDADDRWKPDRLERGVSVLEGMPEIGLVHGEVEAINPRGATLKKETNQIRKYYQLERKSGSGHFLLLEDKCILLSSTILFRRECLNRVGYYDLAFPIYEDYDWYLRFALCYPIRLLEAPPIAQYRRHPGNVSSHYDSRTIATTYIAILEKQLTLIGEKYSGPAYRKAKGRVLAKLAEFYSVTRDRGGVKASLYEALRLDPVLALNWRSLKRFLLALF